MVDEAEWSPDRHWIAFTAYSSQQDRQAYVVTAEHPEKWSRIAEVPSWTDKPHWSVDGRTIYFYSMKDGFPCIWSRTFDRKSGLPLGTIVPVHHFHNVRRSPIHISQPVRGFAVTADRLYLNLAEVSGAVWLSVNKK